VKKEIKATFQRGKLGNPEGIPKGERRVKINDINARRLAIVIENDTIGDNLFNPLLVEALRDYANMVEQHRAGHEGVEVYNSPNGTKLTIIANTWFGTLLPDSGRRLADR